MKTVKLIKTKELDDAVSLILEELNLRVGDLDRLNPIQKEKYLSADKVIPKIKPIVELYAKLS